MIGPHDARSLIQYLDASEDSFVSYLLIAAGELLEITRKSAIS
jgi:hypothetical protein